MVHLWLLVIIVGFIPVSSAKPFFDLQFDLNLNKGPKECFKRDRQGRCLVPYAISILESLGDFDLHTIMLQEGHIPQVTNGRRKQFREDTIVTVPAAFRHTHESNIFVGIKLYGISQNAQDYFVLDATKFIHHSASSKSVASFDTDDLSCIAVLKRGKVSYDTDDTAKAGRTCVCQGYTCSCCTHLDIPKIELNQTGCLNLTYLPNEYAISFTISLDGLVVYNSTVSAGNPPPVCYAVSSLKDYASLCIKFHGMDFDQGIVSGCGRIEAELYHVRVAQREIGCFHMGAAQETHLPSLPVL